MKGKKIKRVQTIKLIGGLVFAAASMCTFISYGRTDGISIAEMFVKKFEPVAHERLTKMLIEKD